MNFIILFSDFSATTIFFWMQFIFKIWPFHTSAWCAVVKEFYYCTLLCNFLILFQTRLPNIRVHAYFAPVTPPASVGGSRQRYCKCCVILWWEKSVQSLICDELYKTLMDLHLKCANHVMKLIKYKCRRFLFIFYSLRDWMSCILCWINLDVLDSWYWKICWSVLD